MTLAIGIFIGMLIGAPIGAWNAVRAFKKVLREAGKL